MLPELWVVLLCLSSPCFAQWLTVTHAWSSVDFDYPNWYMRQVFQETGEHIPDNVVMVDVDMYKGRVFVTTPSLIAGTPATLSTVVLKPDKNGFPLLRPFPDWSWHNVTDPSDCHSIRSIFRIKIDKLGRLWAIDSGVSFAFNDRRGRFNCNPKILVFDLKRGDRLIRKFEIDKLDLDEDSLLLNLDVQIMNDDGSETFVYIADSMGTRLVVYDFAKNQFHAIFHPFFFPDPARGFYDVNGKMFTVTDGLFAVAIDPVSDILYFHALSSGRECSVNAALVRNKTLTEEQSRQFVMYPKRPYHVTSEVITKNGLLVFSSLEENSLLAWDTKSPHDPANYVVLARDKKALQFTTGMKLAGDKFLMMTARLQNLLVTGVPNKGEINYRIVMGDTQYLDEVTHHIRTQRF